jgi:hypothetical protein
MRGEGGGKHAMRLLRTDAARKNEAIKSSSAASGAGRVKFVVH